MVHRVVEDALSTSGPFMASDVGELLVAMTSQRPYGWQVVGDYLEYDCRRIAER